MNSLTDLNNFSNSGIMFNDTRTFSLEIDNHPAPVVSTSRGLTVNMPASMPLNRFVGQAAGQVTKVTGPAAGSIRVSAGDVALTTYPDPTPAGVVYQEYLGGHYFTGMSPAVFRYIASGLCSLTNHNCNMYYPSGNVTLSYQWQNYTNIVSSSALPFSMPSDAVYIPGNQSNIAAPLIFANAAITNGSVTVGPYWSN